MKRVIVRFLLRNSSHTLDVVVSEAEAKDLIRKWKEAGKAPLTFDGHDKDQERNWSIRCDEISTIFTLDYDRILEDNRRRMEAQSQQPLVHQTYARPSDPPTPPPYHGWGPSQP